MLGVGIPPILAALDDGAGLLISCRESPSQCTRLNARARPMTQGLHTAEFRMHYLRMQCGITEMSLSQ